MSDQSFDVVIVGGGLSGSSLASVLARDGHEVLVLEREIEFVTVFGANGWRRGESSNSTRSDFAMC